MLVKRTLKLIVTGILFSLFLATFLSVFDLIPYNVFDAMRKDEIAQIPEVQEKLDGHTILSTKYIGSHTYRLYTAKEDFIVVEDRSDREFGDMRSLSFLAKQNTLQTQCKY